MADCRTKRTEICSRSFWGHSVKHGEVAKQSVKAPGPLVIELGRDVWAVALVSTYM